MSVKRLSEKVGKKVCPIKKFSFLIINNNINNNNWFLQRKGIEPTQIPVTSINSIESGRRVTDILMA